MGLTSEYIKLGKLEDVLNQINNKLKNEIKDNPNNLNTYDSQSISIIVYEEGYIDYDARMLSDELLPV